MTMAIDNQQRFGGMNFDHMPYTSAPQFTNPWTASSAPQNQTVYAPPPHADALPKQGQQQAPARLHSNVSMAPYPNAPLAAASAGSSLQVDPFASQDVLTMSQDLLSPARTMSTGYGSEHSYASASSPVHNTYPPVTSPYESMGYAPAPVRSTYNMQSQEQARRLSQPAPQPENSRSFGDAIDASRGMIAMSQNQTTPRNIYGPQADRAGRGSVDSYGFPGAHSTSSSISSGAYPSYFGGSVDSSVSDYSNTGSDIDSVSSRTLPRPSGLLTGGLPPAPQSMMSQFSSKVSSSTQKKHKCKVCDKRFTRPSSLQTHMYSHTGEKPFSCEVEGCGRHFSVVSNLRRHRKVHKGEAPSDAGSEGHHSDE